MGLQDWDNPREPYRARVTIRIAGSLAFSLGAANKYGFGSTVRAVCLAYDRENRLIVIRPCDESDQAAIRIKRQGTQWLLWIRNFFDRFDIPYADRRRRYEVRRSERYEGAFEVSLSAELTEEDEKADTDGVASETVTALQ